VADLPGVRASTHTKLDNNPGEPVQFTNHPISILDSITETITQPAGGNAVSLRV